MYLSFFQQLIITIKIHALLVHQGDVKLNLHLQPLDDILFIYTIFQTSNAYGFLENKNIFLEEEELLANLGLNQLDAIRGIINGCHRTRRE